ncbi:MAG: MurR/RpiR family transcriptional regulator [Firmicutes bacterium]|nr:MurR/RpiR family transcriptional regulator [Bacillota bacterium]MDH7496715.1 MurR/RpiR family transcriptional regulator [Bacillota bacterium]
MAEDKKVEYATLAETPEETPEEWREEKQNETKVDRQEETKTGTQVATQQAMQAAAQQTRTADCCLAVVRGGYGTLAPAEQRVAFFILEHPESAAGMTSIQLAAAVGVSESTVVKCCQRLGFTGFAQVKLALVRELATSREGAFGKVEPEDDVSTICDKIFTATLQAVEDTAKVLDPGALSLAADAIYGAKRVFFFGVGSSGIVAQDAQLKFMRIGMTAFSYPDAHAQITQAALLGEGDVAVVITYSGRTREATDIIDLARKGGACTICITNFPASPAAQGSDIVLCTTAHEATRLRGGAMTSRVTQLVVIDCLFTAVAMKQSDEAVERLKKTVDALASRKV